MTAQPLPTDAPTLLDELQQEWFQPIRLPLESYTEFAQDLTEQLGELEDRFATPRRPSPWGR